ncbi:MAG: GNAT family N-acetyltransferase [Dehalococcoidia bacterium]|jgi:GNAT superfamily N-acetyltransferase
MTGKNWDIKRCQKGDEAEIIKLREIVFGDKVSIEHWKWQFLDNPSGPAIIWLAIADGNVVGQYALALQRLKIGDEIVLGSYGLDEMTHHDYRGRGIITTLAEQVFKDAAQEGVDVTYGIPNEQIHWLYLNRLNWFDVSEIQMLCKIFNFGKVLEKKANLPKWIGDIIQPVINIAYRILDSMIGPFNIPELEVKEVNSFDDDINDFFIRASKDKSIIAVRDKKYLNWRFTNKPGANYRILYAKKRGEILGYITFGITKKRDALNFGSIADILTLPGDSATARILIHAAIEKLREEGMDIVIFRTLKSIPYYGIAIKLGFVPIWYKKTQLSARINNGNIPLDLLQNPLNWYFSISDTDEA